VILKRITGGSCFGKSNVDQKLIKFVLINIIAQISLYNKAKSHLYLYSGSIDPEYKTFVQL